MRFLKYAAAEGQEDVHQNGVCGGHAEWRVRSVVMQTGVCVRS
jgi:hypothetical protein